jgi:hypothetical protein
MSVAVDLEPRVPRPRRAADSAPAALQPAMAGLDDLLGAPSDTAAWWIDLASRVDALADAVTELQVRAEGPAGLYADVLDHQPRLASQIRSLTQERAGLADDLARLRRAVSSSMGAPEGVAVAASSTAEVLARVRRHHRRTARIVHEAYQLDLGGGD